MIKAVIDTNVFLSALFWSGKPNEVVRLALSKHFIAITSLPILEELENKLLKKFKYPKDQTETYLKLIIEAFSLVKPKTKVIVVEDSDDNKIIEAALESKADYIVTGDKHLLKIGNYCGIKILTPNNFLKKI
jgi:uncharacterized protein